MTPGIILFSFKGRLNRKPYWLSSLRVFIGAFFVLIAINGLAAAEGTVGHPSLLIGLRFPALIITWWMNFALGAKRLHDRNKTGWLMLVAAIPIIGWIWFLIEAVQEGSKGPNRFGPDPLVAFDAPAATDLRAVQATPTASTTNWLPFLLVGGGVIAVIAAALAFGGDLFVDPATPSEPLFTKLVTAQIDSKDEEWCLNPVKIKYASNNMPMTMGPPPAPQSAPVASPSSPDNSSPPADQAGDTGVTPDTGTSSNSNNASDATASDVPPAPAMPAPDGSTDANATPAPAAPAAESAAPQSSQENSADNSATPAPAVPSAAPEPAPAAQNAVAPSSPDGFPLIFAEEAFVKWNGQDDYVMSLLIGGGYIAVHKGGYSKSMTEPGSPGSVYAPASLTDVQNVIDDIHARGDEVDLTDKGRASGVWDASKGFCLQGHRHLSKIAGWTAPAADGQGNMTTHVNAELSFMATHLGRADGDINPLGLDTESEHTYDAVLYNDGWRIITVDGDAVSAPPPEVNSSGGFLSGLFGWALAHHLMSGDEERHDGDSENSEPSGEHDEDKNENSTTNNGDDDNNTSNSESHNEDSNSSESGNSESGGSSESGSSSSGPD